MFQSRNNPNVLQLENIIKHYSEEGTAYTYSNMEECETYYVM